MRPDPSVQRVRFYKMSYGPALPPHLQRKREKNEDRLDAASDDGDAEEEDSAYGPAPPPHLSKQREPEDDDEEEEQMILGPRPPPGYSREAQSDSDSENDGGIIGPLPPKPGEDSGAASASAAADVERRARKMLDKIEGRNFAAEPKRESWMLELPAEKAKNFGLGPRQFSKGSGSGESSSKKREARQKWAETPEMRAKRERGEAIDGDDGGGGEGESQEKDVLEYLASLKRDQEMEKVTKELREKRGTESLMEKHTKTLSKKAKKEAKKEKESGKRKERRPFDRDVDLQANRFDNAAKEAMLKRARQLDNRFSSGSSKYL